MDVLLSLTASNILSKIDELDIISYYWMPNFKLGKTYPSPFREDNRPSFNVFKASHGSNKYLWKDFGTGESGNCFHLVEKLEYVNYYGALNTINKDFKLGLNSIEIDPLIEKLPLINPKENLKSIETPIYTPENTTSIRVIKNTWKPNYLEFWSKYGINSEHLMYYNIHPVFAFSINGQEAVKPELAYVYMYNYNNFLYSKIYQPKSIKYKWICNTNANIIEGYEQLVRENKKWEYLFITKSLKDVICLRLLGFQAISPQSESTNITSNFIDRIKPYGNNVITLFDNDNTGLLRAKLIQENFGIPSIFFDECKDVSDFIAKFGLELTRSKLWQLIRKVV